MNSKNIYNQSFSLDNISQDIVPKTNKTFNLGCSSRKWDEVYASTINYEFLNPPIISGSCLWTGSGTSIYYNSGSVGIGTINPVGKLDVSQGTRTGIHASHNPPLYITSDLGDANNGVEIRHLNGTQGIGIGYNSIYATGSIADQNINIMPRGNGKLGVGTTNPGGKLTVSDPNATTGLSVTIGAGNPNAELLAIDQWGGGRKLTVSPSEMIFTGVFNCSTVKTDNIEPKVNGQNLSIFGSPKLPTLSSATTNNVLYYDTSSFSLSYGAPFIGTHYTGSLTFTGPRTLTMTYTAYVIGKLITFHLWGSGVSGFNPTTQSSTFSSGTNSLPAVLRPNLIFVPHTCVFSGKQNTADKLYQLFIYDNGNVQIMTADTTSFVTSSSYQLYSCSTSYVKL